MNFRYPKKEKLKSKKLIDRLFSEGSSVNKYPLKLIYLDVDTVDGPQFKAAVSVSKRNFKTAVSRMYVKRLLRESYRLNKHLISEGLSGNYVMIFLYTGKEKPDFHSLDSIMKKLLKKFAEQIKN